jgi:hypothetical protein
MSTSIPSLGGFAAGTPVHTDHGLVPIEQIRAGDLVASKPERGGSVTYKPVTKTVAHELQPVVLLRLALLEGPRSLHTTNQFHSSGETVGRGKAIEGSGEHLIVGIGKPFFAKRHGTRYSASDPDVEPNWTEVCWLDHCTEVETLNGTTAAIGNADTDFIHASGQAGIGYVPFNREWSDGGDTVDYSAWPLVVESVDYFPIRQADAPQLLMTVYDIEVEDHRTYFVGQAGLWVAQAGVKAVVPAAQPPAAQLQMATPETVPKHTHVFQATDSARTPKSGSLKGGSLILILALGVLLWSFLWVGFAAWVGLRGLPVMVHLLIVLAIPVGVVSLYDGYARWRGRK